MHQQPCEVGVSQVNTEVCAHPHPGKPVLTGMTTRGPRKYRRPGVTGGLVVVILLAAACGGDAGIDDGAQARSSETAAETMASGPEISDLTAPQRNALRSATDYLRLTGFSRQGLINQLSSNFGDRYSVEDATIAVDRLQVDWNAQAARSAQQYLAMSGFSCQGLISQLSSPYGENYTVEQATAGAKIAGAC